MGGGASKTKSDVSTFTVTVIYNNEGCTTIDVEETATLDIARKEIELEADEFAELPQNGSFNFMYKGSKCSKRKECDRLVRDAGADARLTIISSEKEQNLAAKEEVIKGKVVKEKVVVKEEIVKLPESVEKNKQIKKEEQQKGLNNANEVQEQQKNKTKEQITSQNSSITDNKKYQLQTASAAFLEGAAKGAVELANCTAVVMPVAFIFVQTVKGIYDLVQQQDKLRVEILNFLDFLNTIESSVINGLKNFQTKEPILLINSKLEDALKIIELSQNRKGFQAFFCAKVDRDRLKSIKASILETMEMAKFTMQVDIKADLLQIMKRDEALYEKLPNNSTTANDALEAMLNAGNEDLKNEILSHLKMQEQDLLSELNALKEGQTKILTNQDISLNNQTEMMKKLNLIIDKETKSLSTSLKQMLDPLNFDVEINGAVERFHTGTREWAFNDFDNWVLNEPDSKFCVLSSGAGMGKTGIMSMLVRNRQNYVIAHHFCRHDDNRKRNPKHILCSLAYQIASKIPLYQEELENLGNTRAELYNIYNVTSLFDKLLREPLSKVKNPFETRQIILIDALDECEHDGENDFLKTIRDNFKNLPSWLGVFLTTRPEMGIMKKLKAFQPIPLVADSEKNMYDICLYIKDTLKNLLAGEDEVNEGSKILAAKSNGVFIYARYAVEKINPQDTTTIEDLKQFPDGIEAFYESQFERLLGGTDFEPNSLLWSIIESVVAAEEPLHIKSLDELLNITNKRDRKRAVAKLSSLFPVRDHRLHVFHKSVKDWLVDEEREGEPFFVNLQPAHKRLGERCLTILKDVQNITDVFLARYAVKHIVAHLCKGNRDENHLADQARNIMFQFQWLLQRAKIGPLYGLVEDSNRIFDCGVRDKAFLLLRNSFQLAQSGLAMDPRQISAQLVARLMGYEETEEEIGTLLSHVRAWKGPSGGKGWWCPMQQTFEPAGTPCVGTFFGHARKMSITSVAINNKGTKVISGSADTTVKLWNVRNGECIFTFEGHEDYITGVAFCKDGRKIASASEDGTLKVWDIEDRECMLTCLNEERKKFTCIAFSNDCTKLVSGSEDNHVKIWDTNKTDCISVLSGHLDFVRSAVFNHDDTLIVSGAEDKSMKLWNVATSECIFTFDGDGEIHSVSFSNDGTRIVSGVGDSINIWDTTSKECTCTLEGHRKQITAVAFSFDGSKVLSASFDKKIKMWDVNTGECISTFKGHHKPVTAIAVTNNSTNKTVSVSDDGRIKIWDVEMGEELQRSKLCHKDSVMRMCLNSDNTILTTGSRDCDIRVWNTATGECIQILTKHNDWVRAIKFSKDGTKMASASNEIIIWDTKTWEILHMLNVGDANSGEDGEDEDEDKYLLIKTVTFDKTGARLLSGDEHSNLKLWNIDSGECISNLEGHTSKIASARFSNFMDGKETIISRAAMEIKFWNPESAVCKLTITHESINSIDFNDDYTKMISGSDDKAVKIWDLGTGMCITTLSGHTDFVLNVSYSNDFTMIASTSRDDSVKIWSVEKGECLFTGPQISDEYKADFDQAIGSIKQFFHFLVNEKTYEDKKTSYTIGISGDSEQNPKVKFNRKNKDLAYFKEDSIVHFLKRIF